MKRPSRRFVRIVAVTISIIGALMVGLTACQHVQPPPNAQAEAITRSQNRDNYVPQNDVEGRNYNARQAISDDPATLLWCSAYPTNQNVKPFTVPIAGKLTSGNKRPYSTLKEYPASIDEYSPELPGPDGFYGSSGEYRYGFDPAGNYHEFYGLETYCTTVPSITQQATTDISITVAGDLNDLDRRAQEALTDCRAVDPNPSVPCPAAAEILGVS